MTDRLPGPRGVPLLGMAPAFFRDPFAYADEVGGHGDLVEVPFPGQRLVYVLAPELLEVVLVKQARRFVKGAFMSRAEILFGGGLLLAEGDAWRRQRVRMAPAFRHSAVREMARDIQPQAAETFAGWGAGGERSISDDFMALTLEVALRQLFGASAGPDLPVLREAFQTVSEHFASLAEAVAPLPLWVPTPRNRRFRAAKGKLDGVVSRILTERRARAAAGDGLGTDLLGRLLAGQDEDGSGMSEEQLQDEVRTLLLAGHETTSIALTTTAWLLARHPEVQQRVAAEALDAPEHLDDQTPLPEAKAALDEAMRLYPPAPVMAREPTEDVTLGEHRVSAGQTLILAPFIVQRREQWFTEPLAYRPERWTDALRSSLPRFAYFPFGGGPRICIGAHLALLEARIVLVELLRRFRLEVPDGAELDLYPSITLRPKTPVRLRLRPR